ncbi:hypothetical protein [Streptomyces sp. NPDC001876]|uniref:hypothetical protein n=1 Tax=Streptomyces sp. NPDC001876 TaxID=3154402 RepID=UPI0033275A67
MPERRTELQIGGSWTNVTTDVRESAPITIDRGAADEATSSDPSKCTLTLNNRHGKYSPRNPLSPYYGLIGRNTPLRVSVQGPESYLAVEGIATSYARTPDAAALDIVGDIDLRAEVTMDWSEPGIHPLVGKWISATNQRSYALSVDSGTLSIWWSTAGTAGVSVSRTLPDLPRRAALRGTLDVNNGSGGYTVNLYWAESLDGPWTAVGASYTTTPATSIYVSTAPLELAPPNLAGAVLMQGRIHRAEVRSGVGGTVVASPDVRALAEGATGWTDSAGRVWTLGAGASISDRQYRFHGEVSAWPSRWDVSGADVYVPIEAAGITRRTGQGKKALDSTLRRRIPSASGLLAYWPMEDGQDAASAYSPLPDVRPMTLTGFDFAADDTLGGAAALPKAKNPATLRATVPRSATAGWQVEWVYNLPALPAVQTEMMRLSVTGATMRTVILYASAAAIRLEVQSSDGTVIGAFTYSDAGALSAFVGKWNRLAIYTGDYGGGATLVTATWRDVTTNFRYFIATAPTTGQGRIDSVSAAWGAALEGTAIGHLAVFSTPGTGVLDAAPTTAIFEGADDGFLGETALARLVRLGAEESAQLDISVRGVDYLTPSERMGPQRPGTLLDLLEECAETDGGILYEHLDRTALVYRDRQSLYNQAVGLALDYTVQGEVPPPLEPAPDDQAVRNDVTVTRSGGSSGRAVLESGPLSVQPPPAGIGPYDEALTLSLYTDTQPLLIAQWRMHLGTWDEERYPTITVWLHAAPHLIGDVLGLDIGDRVTIDNLPPWLPPGLIDQHMRGYIEVLGLYDWTLSMNCVPAGPWTVGVVEDSVLGRPDTDGCTLTGAITSSATSVAVTSSPGPRWIDSASFPAMFPFDVTVGGEVVRVTACTGTGLAQTLTVTRSVNGIVKSHSAGAPLRLTYPMRVAL